MPMTTAFCPVPVLLKRPRAPPFSLKPLNHRQHLPHHSVSVTCSRQQPAPDQSLAKKVELCLLESEQRLDIPKESRILPVLPVSLDLLNYHARVASRKADSFDIAERLYRRCIDASPTDGRAWLGLARLLSNKGDTTGARRTFRNAVGASPRNSFILQAWGVLEERSGNLERAKGLYLAALRADEKHAPSWVALGLWHQRHENNISSARMAFRRGAEADPSNYYIWHVWGVLEKSCRRFARARECFQKGISANPYNAATFVLWGSLEDEVGNFKVATNLFEKAHRVSRNNIHAYISHAVTADKMGNVNKARSLLYQAIRIRPTDPSPRQALAMLEFRNGDTDKARRILQDTLNRHPKHTPTWHAWARVECAVENYVRARKLFQEAVWAAPRSPHVVRTWHSWAMMEMKLGRFDLARRYFAHGLDVENKSVVLLTGMAELEAKEGNISRAREYMERCIRLEPWRSSMWRLYQQLEAMYGSPRRAQLVYERSVVINQQVEERLSLAEPLPGDFQGAGMWIDALELPPDKSAFNSVGSRSINSAKRTSMSSRRRNPRKPRDARKGSGHGPLERTTNEEAQPLSRNKDAETSTTMRTAFGF